MVIGKKRVHSQIPEDNETVKEEISELKHKSQKLETKLFPYKLENKPKKAKEIIKGRKSVKNISGPQTKKNASTIKAELKKGEQEKTDWRKLKQEKKELKLKRKQAKDSYTISVEAKQIHEKLKCRNTREKSVLVEKLYKLFTAGDVLRKIVMAHDTSRIVQCMLKYAAPSLREQLSEKLLPFAVEMSISKYSHFCVLRMFKYGSSNIKSKLVEQFFGHIVKLACHKISSKILDHAYLFVANAKQKSFMRQEFYGDLYKHAKDNNVKELLDAYKESPNMKASILGSVKSNLEHVANKKLIDNSLVHAVMLEYLRVYDGDDGDNDKIEEIVATYTAHIPFMLSTKDGSQAAIISFYKASPKHRRAIIKGIKEHLVKICTHEHGHIFILALLNSLDDTKATKKAIYDNLHPELQTLMANQWGRRVIEWLIAPADTACFHPNFIARIEGGLLYGKKDKELRRKEIFEQVEGPIANAMAEDPEFWLSNKHIAVVTAGILNKIKGAHFVKAATSLATIICNPSWCAAEGQHENKAKGGKECQDIEKIVAEATQLKKRKKLAKEKAEKKQTETVPSTPGIEEAGLHVALKKIIRNDKLRVNSEDETFGAILVQHLNRQTLEQWIAFNRGCFILLNILENNIGVDTTQQLKELLHPLKETLEKLDSSGSKLLLKKLQF